MNVIKALLQTIIQIVLAVAVLVGLLFGFNWIMENPEICLIAIGIIFLGLIVILLFLSNLKEISSKDDKRKDSKIGE